MSGQLDTFMKAACVVGNEWRSHNRPPREFCYGRVGICNRLILTARMMAKRRSSMVLHIWDFSGWTVAAAAEGEAEASD
jgi:hypothetical protein